MSKLYSVSGYVYDKDEDASKEYIERSLKSAIIDDYWRQLHVEESDGFADDRVDDVNCDLSILDSYFNNESNNDDESKREIKVGGYYKHFKGHVVKVLSIATDTEHTNCRYVVYKHIKSGRVWARPYFMFNSLVDKEKYPDVNQLYRFERVNFIKALLG